MKPLFHEFIFRPLFNLMVGLYNGIPGHDLGIVVVVLTVLIRIVFWPLTGKQLKAQKRMQDLQPRLAALKVQYKGDREGMGRATMELYKQEKINPLASCLPLLVQLPALLALYWVFQAGLKSESFDALYAFVGNPGTFSTKAFGILELAKPSIPLAVLAGITQYWQGKMLITTPPSVAGEGAKDEAMMAAMNKQMKYMMPAMTVVIGATLPAGLTLYWFVSSLLAGVQQTLFFRKHKTEKVKSQISNHPSTSSG